MFHRSDSSALAAAAKERLHRSLALPTSYNKQPATLDEATKELLHQSLALPTIYQDLKKSEPAGTPQQQASKLSDKAPDAVPLPAAGKCTGSAAALVRETNTSCSSAELDNY